MMKLKPDWLNHLSSAAREHPQDLPAPLPRTTERVLSHLREEAISRSWLQLWLRPSILVAVAALVFAGLLTRKTQPVALQEPSLASLQDMESTTLSLPTDALLGMGNTARDDTQRLSQEITQLLKN